MVARKRTTTRARAARVDVVPAPVVTTPSRVREVSQAPFFQRALPFLYLGMIALAFGFGVLWQKVNGLESAPRVATGDTVQPGAVATPAPIDIDQIKGLFGQDLIKFGDANKKVLFVAVEDPSCPYCHIAGGKNPELNNQSGSQFKLVADGGTYVAPMTEMKKLVDSGQAGFVYIYTPGHGAGEMGQKALYCAFEKGKFWQAHDLLYTNAGYNLLNNTIQNDKAKSGQLADFLKAAVPAAEMKACLDGGKYDGRIATDTAVAQSLGVTGTPGFFVNTTRYAGAYSYTEMEGVVKAALGN